jgi:iron complex outermembrane receptor protein
MGEFTMKYIEAVRRWLNAVRLGQGDRKGRVASESSRNAALDDPRNERRGSKAVGLMFATLLSSLGAASSARAQVQAAEGPTKAVDTGIGLEEIIVTATRREESLNRVPISVSAVTQASIDKLGLKSITDLQGAVPSLAITTPPPDADAGGNRSLANFTIRGIVSQGGAATTGVYLDDVPLQKRAAVSSGQSNGTPTVPLFDLDRIEVLRGPQGTLYGGSSEGGAIRFLLPQPSLTDYSGLTRAEVSKIDSGEENYEVGGAWGGPLVKDVLGIRLMAYGRHNGGWIDMRDPYTLGEPVRYKDANSTDVTAFRGAVAYAPTDKLLMTLSLYDTRFDDAGGPSGSTFIQTRNGAPTFSTPTACFNGFILPGSCATPGAFVQPGQTYGPYALGPYDSLEYFKTPSVTTLNVGSFSINYDFGPFTLKSISSYLTDKTDGNIRTLFLESLAQGGITLFRQYPEYPPFWVDHNYREGFIQELRLASKSSSILDWVAGLYYSDFNNHTSNKYGLGPHTTLAEADQISLAAYGVANANNLLFLPLLPDGTIDHRDEYLDDKEYAAYADATWHVTDKFSLIAGVRYSIVKFNFSTDYYGAITGHLVPTLANSGITAGDEKASPITPKAGVQYQWTPNAMIYATAAKGFRAGGVNEQVVYNVCGPGLSAIGLTPGQLPHTYDPDSVWSYEAGAKIRLLDRIQLNSSVYRINWSKVQTGVALGGCPEIEMNAASATSTGFDVQAEAVLVQGLTASVSVGYTDAEYSKNAFGPQPTVGSPALIVVKGDKLPVPPWQGIASLQYEVPLADTYRGYARYDFQYTGAYQLGSGPGTLGYSPDNEFSHAGRLSNVRLGLIRDSWDVNLFVYNLFESRDRLASNGGSGECPVSEGAACSDPGVYNPVRTSITYQPRTIGLQVNYKY